MLCMVCDAELEIYPSKLCKKCEKSYKYIKKDIITDTDNPNPKTIVYEFWHIDSLRKSN